MRKAALAAAAAASAIAIGVGPATAASVTVSGGPNFTAISTNLVLTSGSITIGCSSVTKSGSFTPGSYTTPAQIGVITSSTASGCTAFGVPATWTHHGTWQIWATGAQSGGLTPGEIRNISGTVQVPALGCTVSITGTVPGMWNNTQVLTLSAGPGLVTTGTGFCIGLGSTGTLSGTLNVTGSPSPIYVL